MESIENIPVHGISLNFNHW